MRKGLLIFVFFLIAGVVLLKTVTRTPIVKFKTEEVKRTTISKSISASGKVISEEEVELKFQTSGRLSWVGVTQGDSVSAWQAIAQLDTRELQKTLEKYLRDYSKQRADFEETYRVTYKEQTPETALTDTVKRILQKNQWDLEKAVLDVELKDIALKFATLVTPISGIVTHIDTPVTGVNITPATAVFKVASPDKVIFKANIDETDVAGIVPGLTAKITLDAYQDKEFEGVVSKVSFTSVSTSGGGTAFPVTISLPKNEDLKFKLGMNGDSEIIIEQRLNALAISSEAVMERDGKNFVWLVKKGKATKQEIKIGLTTDEKVEILDGLKEEDLVIKSEVSKIKEGQGIDSKY